jgi:hypothetical protein
MNKIDLKQLAGYDADFSQWSEEQAALLRAGRFDRLDAENIAEEIESLGRSQKHEIVSRLTVVLVHLLKWSYQAGGRSPSWQSSIILGRDEIERLIEESPSLRTYPGEMLHRAYRKAPRIAAAETGLPQESFPQTCPFSIEQVLDDDFWPDRRQT